MMQEYLLKKDVNWSMLSQGFAVPVSQRRVFFSALQLELNRGEKRNIKIVIDGEEFDASISNMRILQKKYKDHGDIVRILYSKKSGLPAKLQAVFHNTLDRCIRERNNQNVDDLANHQSRNTNHEFLVLYTTPVKDVFYAEAITNKDWEEFRQETSQINEIDYENEINNLSDDTATIIQKQMNVKIRKMDRKICERLKEIYDYRCQICGFGFREKYGVDYAEAHHIIPFTQSMNNNPENILILCPNHHRVIHKCNPMYENTTKIFYYKNSLTEKTMEKNKEIICPL